MAYACPVCRTLSPDGEHLAHHLAIVAMTRGGEHEVWLDDHTEGWREASPEDLAAFATEYADEVDREIAGESAGERPDVDHDHHGLGGEPGGRDGRRPGGHAGGRSGGPGSPGGAGDDEAAAVLAEARKITERMLGTDDRDVGDEDTSDSAVGEATADDPPETDSDE